MKIDTASLDPPGPDDEEAPQSVIHVPSDFGRFVPPGSIHRTASRLSQALAHRSHRSLSQSGSSISLPLEPKQTQVPQSTQTIQPLLERPGSSSRDRDTPEPSSAISAAPSVALSLASSLTPSNTASTAPSESTLRAEQELDRSEAERQVSRRESQMIESH